jgi:hypothetical protein
MAQEITVQTTLAVLNGNFKLPTFGGKLLIDQTTLGGGSPGLMACSNAANGTNVPTTGITNLGYTFIANLDAAAILTYGPVISGTLEEFGKLKPGEYAVLRLKPGITWAILSTVNNSLAQVVQTND